MTKEFKDMMSVFEYAECLIDYRADERLVIEAVGEDEQGKEYIIRTCFTFDEGELEEVTHYVNPC